MTATHAEPLATSIRTVLDATPYAAYLLDEEFHVVFVNAAAITLTGWSAADLLGNNPGDVPLFGYSFIHSVQPALQRSGHWSGEAVRFLPDASQRTVRAHWSAVKNLPIVSYIGIELDITERKALEIELAQSRKLAKIGILSEGIAHELRNPLSYALSAAQLLGDDRLPPEVREQCLNTISTGLKKAGLIVENLLSLGRPAARISRASVFLASVVDEAIEAVSNHETFRNVRFETTFPERPLRVSGNHDMLVQVLHNVLTNALNEMPEGGCIAIEGMETETRAVLSVRDSGPGVTEEQLKHLFDPFYTSSSSGKGTGLGLTLCHFIMKEHDGSIEVESTPGSGACFTLTFPLFQDEAIEPDSAE